MTGESPGPPPFGFWKDLSEKEFPFLTQDAPPAAPRPARSVRPGLHLALALLLAVLAAVVLAFVTDLSTAEAATRSGGGTARGVHNPQWTVTAP